MSTKATTQYWLLKSEPGSYSIDDLKRDRVTTWDGVRNYQARNFMRDDMQSGDLFLFYHSSAEPSGIVGVGKIVSRGLPDLSALDKKSKYYDPKATKDNPIWNTIKVRFIKKFKTIISLEELKKNPKLKKMLVIQRGQRLSVQPVTKEEFETIISL